MLFARVVKLVHRGATNPPAARRAGSIPAPGTTQTSEVLISVRTQKAVPGCGSCSFSCGYEPAFSSFPINCRKASHELGKCITFERPGNSRQRERHGRSSATTLCTHGDGQRADGTDHARSNRLHP